MITAAGFVALAGIGAVVRAEVGRRTNKAFPAGTLLVNVMGAFLLGLLATTGPPVLTILGAAGLGAMTTFSSFAHDAVALIEERRPASAALYILSTVGLGLMAAGAGLALVG